MYPLSQLHQENRCPDCLFLDIRNSVGSKSIDNQLVLHLTINFEEQWEHLPLGRVKFGLRSGELRFLIKNGYAPYSQRLLVKELPLQIHKEITTTDSTDMNEVAEINLSLKEINLKGNLSKKKYIEKIEKIELQSCQVSSKGGEDSPAWVFRLKSQDDPILLGLIEQELCTINIADHPCIIDAKFEVSKTDVWLTDAEGVWPQNISSNKRAIIEREIVFFLLKTRLKPYLSRILLTLDMQKANQETESVT